jgi:adenylate cyclase
MLTLHVVSTGAHYDVPSDGGRVECSLGRENSSIVLEHASISRSHARIVCEQGVWTIEDLGSKHGTYLNGKRVSTPQVLMSGASLRLGLFELRVEIAGMAQPQDHLQTRELDPEALLPSARPPLSSDALSALLFEAQTSLYPLQDQVSLCRAALCLIMTHVPATRATAQMLSGESCEPVATIDHLARDLPAFALSSSIRQKVIAERKVLWIQDRARSALAAQQSLVLAGITSTIAAPIFEGKNVFGLLYVDVVDGDHSLSEGDSAMVTIVASLLGIALGCGRVVEALTREVEALKALRR